ncbi:hypothetical protein KDD17_00650 [Sulfitobacter albidus]|uniref:Uncharacterized protein n=1 Tax=Sulfitobacter albidus TaxID=2829501 RepID=A0A975JDS2_9RHOB|nr:hypothetical protein [Sulfitobacter albidus]QUJ76619.1 hypothetical protein KDD17_00650 [Sulfitobacter albidus]
MQIWNIEITAPTGNFRATLRITDDGGEMAGKNGAGPMLDLQQDGDSLRWATQIEKPMPMKMKFDGTVDGDQLSGTVKFGIFAKGTFEGTRAA